VNAPEIYFALVAVAVIGLVLYLTVRAEKRRREQMRQQAALLGFSFEEERALDAEPYRELRLFTRGRGRRLKNILCRRSDRTETLVLEFSYKQGGGKSSSHHTLTVMLRKSPGLFAPQFELRPEGIHDKVASWFGYQDIDFPEDPEFSSRYLLRGENEERIREIFSMPVRLQLRERTGWSAEGRGEWVGVYQGSRRAKPEEISGFVQEAEQIAVIIAGALVR
jgi:hypothetical protein